MPAHKKTAEELTRVGRSPGKTAGGRPVNGTAGTVTGCPHALRRIARARAILDPETLSIYVEAVERIESQTPHSDGYHGIPSDPDALDDIALVESAINPILPDELKFRTSRLFGLMSESAERIAS